MSALSRDDVAQVAEISAELATLRSWHHIGTAALPVARLANLFARTKRLLFYHPRAPDPAARNRVIEAVAWIDRGAPGNWYASQLCRDVFVPPGIERRLASALRTFRALEVVLEQIGTPALVVAARGLICEANAPGRRLLERSRCDVAAAIEAARLRRPHPIRVELVPISAPGVPQLWLALVRPGSQDARIERAVATAAARWQLTRRQREVLDHVVRGDANVTISGQLGVSVRAVELHVTALLARANVANRAALAAEVLAMELA